jgi:hypothetical protein
MTNDDNPKYFGAAHLLPEVKEIANYNLMDNVMSLGNSIKLGAIPRIMLARLAFWADKNGYVPYPYACFGKFVSNMQTLRRCIKILEGRGLLSDHQLNVEKLQALADKYRAANPKYFN